MERKSIESERYGRDGRKRTDGPKKKQHFSNDSDTEMLQKKGEKD